MGEKEFSKLCRKYVAYYYGWDNYTEDDIYIVWLSKTIQNNKALLSTTKPDGMYFEITYDGDKKTVYFDAYKRVQHEKHYNVVSEDLKLDNGQYNEFQKAIKKIDPNLELMLSCGEPEEIGISYYCDYHVLYDFARNELNVDGIFTFAQFHTQSDLDKLKDIIRDFNESRGSFDKKTDK